MASIEICDDCAEAIDYAKPLYRIDVQKWHLNKAIARKMVLCEPCGDSRYRKEKLA